MPHLQVLHISGVPSLTYEAVLNFIKSTNQLKFLNVYYLRTKRDEYQILTQVAKDQGLELVLREPRQNNSKELTDENDQTESTTDEGFDEDSANEDALII